MNRIRTTHTGSLPRPPQILQAVREQFTTGKPMNEAMLGRTVGDIVKKQVKSGIDIVTEGEMRAGGVGRSSWPFLDMAPSVEFGPQEK